MAAVGDMWDSCLKPWEPNFSWLEKKESVEAVLFIYVRGQLSPRDIILVCRDGNNNLKYYLYSFDILCPNHIFKECLVSNQLPSTILKGFFVCVFLFNKILDCNIAKPLVVNLIVVFFVYINSNFFLKMHDGTFD